MVTFWTLVEFLTVYDSIGQREFCGIWGRLRDQISRRVVVRGRLSLRWLIELTVGELAAATWVVAEYSVLVAPSPR